MLNPTAGRMNEMLCFFMAGLLTFAAFRYFHHRRCWAHHGPRGFWGGPSRFGGRFDRIDDDTSSGGFGRGFRGRGRGMSLPLRFLSNRLDATPGQERALADAMEKFHAEVAPLHAEVDKTRADLAAAMRKSSFDEVAMGELFARHDDAIEKARRAVVGFGARVHDALDERQRDQLASLIERGHGFSGFGGGWSRDW
ncbi:MAG TPA: periplasmic heavy metal sensor [Polyangia bacterium]